MPPEFHFDSDCFGSDTGDKRRLLMLCNVVKSKLNINSVILMRNSEF